MKYLITFLLIVGLASAGPTIYGPAGMPDPMEIDNIDADSVDIDHLVVNTTAELGASVTCDSAATVDFKTNLFLIGALTPGDQDIILRFGESDANHDIIFNDGIEEWQFDAPIRVDGRAYIGGGSSGGVATGNANLKLTEDGAGVLSLVSDADAATHLYDPNTAGSGLINLGQSGDNDTTRVVGIFNSTDVADFDVGITLAEISTPSALADHGKVYTKTDNELYFQDGAGAEHVVTLGSSDYGEMGNVYGSSATEALAIKDVWYGMYHANINIGEASGFTYTDGSVGSGNITTAQAGAGINIADAAHGLVDGDIICVQSANHTGVDTVTYVDAGNFEITIAYVGDEAGTWQEGSYLECATTGLYRGVWTATISQSDAASRTTIVSPFLNKVQATKATSAGKLANATDQVPMSGNGLMNFTAGDRIWFGLQSDDPQTITFTVRNVSIR